MFSGAPSASDIACNTLTSSGTLITVPAGKAYTGDLCISASVATLGNSNPLVTVNGTNATPAAGTVVGRLNLVGLAATTIADSTTIEIVVIAPAGNSVTIDFTAGATGTSSAVLNGYFYF